jgi:hypothetical protein
MLMVGPFASFGEWAEIRSPVEGHFLESIAPTAFAKTIAETASGSESSFTMAATQRLAI